MTDESVTDMEGRRIDVSGPDPADITDGFHTMQDLYNHRRALTAVLATIAAAEGDSWRSKAHHPDDAPIFTGYFIVGIDLPMGTITYHYELKHWDDFAAVPELEHSPKWDGHNSDDVVTRLIEFSGMLAAAVEIQRLEGDGSDDPTATQPEPPTTAELIEKLPPQGPVTSAAEEGYSPVRVPENTGKHPGESAETDTERAENA